MILFLARRLGWLLPMVLLAGCASPAPVPEVDFTGIMRPLAECRDLYAEVDARVEAAGVRHPAYYRVPGFPYLRSDRLMASFRDEVNDLDRLGAWTRRMREMDQEARDYELRNLNLPRQERADLHGRMHSCGYGLVSLELQQPGVLERLKSSVVPPEEYARAPRTLGLLSLTSGLIRHRWSDRAEAVQTRFLAAQREAPTSTVIWQPTQTVEKRWQPEDFNRLPEDPLGFPGLITTAWRALTEAHAPQLWLADSDALPGRPVLRNGQWDVATDAPVVHYQIGFTRFGGEPLVQIIYFVWSRSAGGPELMQWRVTLDRQGEALLYDSFHPADGVPLWFVAQPLQPRTGEATPLTQPQTTPVQGRPALQLAGDRNVLNHVYGSTEAEDIHVRRHYQLEPFDLLYTVESEQGSVSLFLPDGRLRGSDDQGIAWPWASGLPTDGAIHHFQRQGLDPVHPLHYDDARLLERWFRPDASRPAG